MRWIKSLPGVQVVLSGMSDEEQMADNIRTFSERPDVNEHEREIIKKAAALLRPDVSLPCTKAAATAYRIVRWSWIFLRCLSPIMI